MDNLFRTLATHTERKFLLAFDELLAIAKYNQDQRDDNQHVTVRKFWQFLDATENMPHIGIVGTDNVDPSKYEEQTRQRFLGSTFKFKALQGSICAQLGFLKLRAMGVNIAIENQTLDDAPVAKAPQPIVCNVEIQLRGAEDRRRTTFIIT